MRPSKSILVALCSALIFLISLDYAFAKDNVSQAKEFIQAGMYPQAIAVLEKEIYGNEKAKVKANPTNAEAQFLLGVCYANQGRYTNADDRFASTVKLKPNYGYKIGGAYKDAGLSSLENGNIDNAEALFQKAVKYQPELRRVIATDLLKRGKGNNNDQLLSLAITYNSELRADVSGYYYGLSQSISGEEGVNALKKADEYSGGAYKTEIGNKAIEVCNSKSRPEDRKTCIDRNLEYLSPNQIFESSVRFYARLWGAPTRIVLEIEEWNEITKLNSGDIIHYLSMDEFWVKGKTSQRLWEPAISEDGQIMFMNISEPCPASFKKKTVSAIVYAWIERK